jgi:FKBP-type peptidyl-prolyl cis-trans isomerase FklB
MKNSFLATVLTLAMVAPVFADGTNVVSTNGVSSMNETSKVSYALGMNFGKGARQNDIDIDESAFLQGLHDGRNGTALLTDAELKQVLADFQHSMQAKMQEKRAKLAAKNKVDGEAFLATNKTAPGVITMTNGLQYKVLTDGTGPIPAANDKVKVNYRGTLLDGTEFDSSYKRGTPQELAVGQVIRGWTAALEQMKVGSKWQLFIPSDLAYGEQGSRTIPPNSTLIFEVELLSIQAPVAPAPSLSSPPLTSDIIKVPSAEEMKNGAKIETIKPEDVQKLQNQK